MTWIVVQTSSQREHWVRQQLMRGVCDDIGNITRTPYETYLPRIRVKRRAGLLFPGYLFVRMENNQWWDIRWTPHVLRVILSGDRPYELEERVVKELRKRERGGFVPLPRKPRLVHGQEVRIIRGNFEGSLALYQGQSGEDRVRVLLAMLGGQVNVELAAANVMAIPVVSTEKPERNILRKRKA